MMEIPEDVHDFTFSGIFFMLSLRWRYAFIKKKIGMIRPETVTLLAQKSHCFASKESLFFCRALNAGLLCWASLSYPE